MVTGRMKGNTCFLHPTHRKLINFFSTLFSKDSVDVLLPCLPRSTIDVWINLRCIYIYIHRPKLTWPFWTNSCNFIIVFLNNCYLDLVLNLLLLFLALSFLIFSFIKCSLTFLFVPILATEHALNFLNPKFARRRSRGKMTFSQMIELK